MILVIDAFNLMYKLSQTEDLMHAGRLEDASNELVNIFYELQKKRKKGLEIHLFFDGKRRPGDPTEEREVSGMHLYYGIDRSADYMIKQFVKKAPSPGEIRVVSSDKDVIHHARKGKSHSWTSEEFTVWLKEEMEQENGSIPSGINGDKKPPMKKEDLDYWINMFRKR